MKIDDYIAALTKLRQQYGPDLEVVEPMPMGGLLRKAPLPRIGLTRNDNPRKLFQLNDLDKLKGARVVVLGIGDAKAREDRKAADQQQRAARFAAMGDFNKRLGRGQI